MLKILLLLAILTSASAFASPMDQAMSIKERLRISLWVEGLTTPKPEALQTAQSKPFVLPEEIERALSKM